ncbi:thermonuclease family protein [Limnochorda pilosa]|uniref:thermonuclease family protein n=1 Tax=Limnochorda pilosa TaxID=1555112 RepID=UPI0011875454|nr:thermonuclease family protein [Limnochorda pilosa]
MSHGDTFMVAFAGTSSARVRLIGVGAPEGVHPTPSAEPFGVAAAAFTKGLLPDGRMVNEVLLAAGDAQLYTLPPNVRHVERFR